MNNDTYGRFKTVSYVESDKAFRCVFRNGDVFLFKRELVKPEDDGSEIESAEIQYQGDMFLVKLSSGHVYLVPWDFVRFHCDEKYRKDLKEKYPDIYEVSVVKPGITAC